MSFSAVCVLRKLVEIFCSLVFQRFHRSNIDLNYSRKEEDWYRNLLSKSNGSRHRQCPLARRLFLLGGPVRASGSSTPLARRGQRAYVRATRVFVLRWPEVQIRSRRRRHLSCFLAVGSFPSSFPANDKLIR